MVLRDAFTVVVHDPEVVLRVGLSLFGTLPAPRRLESRLTAAPQDRHNALPWRPVTRVWGAPIRLSARGVSVEGALISSIVFEWISDPRTSAHLSGGQCLTVHSKTQKDIRLSKDGL